MISPFHFSCDLYGKYRSHLTLFCISDPIFLSNTTHWTKSSAAVIHPAFSTPDNKSSLPCVAKELAIRITFGKLVGE